MHSNVWRVPAYLPYIQPRLQPEIVRAAEKKLGVTLPESYLDLLQRQNGGYLRCVLPDADVPHDMIWGIGPHFPSITAPHEQLRPNLSGRGPWVPSMPRRLIPFDGDGHWYLCLDYRSASIPRVSFIDLEREQERQVASSFVAFLQSLRPAQEIPRFGVEQDVPMDDLCAALSKALGVEFEDQGDEDHGYRLIRAALGASGAPAWVWVTPNVVPRGFVRRSDPRYAELASMLPGTGLREPDHPSVVYLVDCTDSLAPRVHAALAKTGMSHLRLW